MECLCTVGGRVQSVIGRQSGADVGGDIVVLRCRAEADRFVAIPWRGMAPAHLAQPGVEKGMPWCALDGGRRREKLMVV